LKKNLTLVEALRAVAETRGATPGQLAIAWVLSRGPHIVPLIGARRRRQLHEPLGALDLALMPDKLEQAERAVPADHVAGNRYPDAGMSTLDSEGRTHSS
jgi:aryl-alcohol dehydrogenase-like predicted oxidoreductase